MSAEPKHFTLKDRWGKEHFYVITPHGGDDAYEMTLDLMALVSGEVLEAALNAWVDGQGLDKSLSVLNNGVSSVFKGLRGDMRKRCFQHVVRDGKPLCDPAEFKAAYEANTGEALLTLPLVEKVNAFVPLGYIYSEGIEMLRKVLPAEYKDMLDEMLAEMSADETSEETQ